MDVGDDAAFIGFPADLLHQLESLLAEDLLGTLEVAIRLGQRALAVHHADSGLFA